MLRFLVNLIEKKPIKIISFTLVIVLILAVGASNVEMATGNETLIQRDTKVYQDNELLESEFGGESIIVLYEAENINKLLSVSSLNHMNELENQLRLYDGIYAIVSPNTLINQMSEKQYEKYKEGMNDVAAGLETMGSKLKEISSNMNQNTTKQAAIPDIDLEEFNKGLQQMVKGQEKLKDGTTNLLKGYGQIGNQLQQAAMNLNKLSEQIPNVETQGVPQQNQAKQIQQMSTQLLQLSKQMTSASESGAALPQVSQNTITGLKKMEMGLNVQSSEMNKLKASQADQMSNLEGLGNGLSEMGDKLITISDNMQTMLSYSDAVAPSIPNTQKTIDKMVYEEDGTLRNMFNEVVMEGKYMMFIVKFEGGIADAGKSEIVNEIKDYLDKNKLESVDTMVTGKPVLDDAIRFSMKDSMKKMLGLSILFMIGVLTIVFRVKWSLLPLVTILIAVVGTVGLMGWLNIPITMVSMAVFPILIGLGIDYSIQFQSRYVEEMNEEVC